MRVCICLQIPIMLLGFSFCDQNLNQMLQDVGSAKNQAIAGKECHAAITGVSLMCVTPLGMFVV